MNSGFGRIAQRLKCNFRAERIQSTLNLLQKKDYRKLWASEFISEIGNYFSFFGVIFYVIELTKNEGTFETAHTLAVIVTFQVIPTLTVGPFVGVLVDRLDRKKILLGTNLLGFLVTVGYSLSRSVQQLYLLVILHSFVRLIFYPTRTAILPRLVEQDQLLHANSMIQISVQFSRLIGPVLAGIMLSQFGFSAGFLTDGATYLIAGITVYGIRTDMKPKGFDEKRFSPLSDMRGAIRIIRDRPQLKYLFSTSFVLLVGVGVLDPLLAPFLNSAFGYSPKEFGFLLALSAICGAVSAFILIARGEFSNKLKMIGSGYLLGGLSLILMAEASLQNNNGYLLLAAGLLGVVNVAIYILTATFIQETVEDANLGKINGIFATNLVLGQLIGSLLASWLIKHFAYEQIFLLVGTVVSLSGLASIYSVVRFKLDRQPKDIPQVGAIGIGK